MGAVGIEDLAAADAHVGDRCVAVLQRDVVLVAAEDAVFDREVAQPADRRQAIAPHGSRVRRFGSELQAD